MNHQQDRTEVLTAEPGGPDASMRTASRPEPEVWELTLVSGEAEGHCLALWEELEKRLGHDRLTSQVTWVRRWLQHYRDMVEYLSLIHISEPTRPY